MSQLGANAVADEPLRKMAHYVQGASGLESGKAIKESFLKWLRTETAHGKAGHKGKYSYDGL
jgi:hypothetical protein